MSSVMSALTLNHLAALIVAALILIVALLLLTSSPKRRRKRVALKDLSLIWTGEGKSSVHIAELAPIWRDKDKAPAGPDFNKVSFKNVRIAKFAAQHIRNAGWFQKAPQQAQVVLDILQILDREGNCPSVVNVTGDTEAKWDSSTYSILGRVTLADHTLNVAERTIAALSDADSRHIIPDAVIAALGHDLGKLESVRDYLYSLGDHPLAAGRALATIPALDELPRKDEILRAIKMHHKAPEGLLGRTIKQADQKARQDEMEMVVKAEAKAAKEPARPTAPEAKPETKKEETPAPLPANPQPPPASGDATAAWQAQADIWGDQEDQPRREKSGEVPKMLDISSWWDAQAFLDDIRPYINKLFGRRWMAFSMPDGYVYVQAKVIEEIARKHAERAGAMDIATMAADDQTMRRVLFTIVQHLRVEHQDIIARGLIQDNFFGGYFTITTKTGKKLRGFYVPFHAEAFGSSVAEMEATKKSPLKDFQSVTAKDKE